MDTMKSKSQQLGETLWLLDFIVTMSMYYNLVICVTFGDSIYRSAGLIDSCSG